MLRTALVKLQSFPDRFRPKPPPPVGVMYYDAAIWLKVLSQTDPKTVRAFARTCVWAYELVDRYWKTLPRFPVTIRIWMRPSKSICTVAKADFSRIITRFDFKPDDNLALEIQVLRQLAMQTDPSKFIKHVKIARAELDCGIEKKAFIPGRVIDSFRKVNAAEFCCAISFDEVKDLGTGKPFLKVCVKAAKPDVALYGVQLARDLAQADGRHGNWAKLLYDIFTIENCTEYSISTFVRCRSTVSTIIDLLKMFVGVPNSKATVEVIFMKTGNGLFQDTCNMVQEAFCKNGLNEHYTINKFSNMPCHGIVIRATNEENCFWFSQWKDHPCDRDIVYLGNKVSY